MKRRSTTTIGVLAILAVFAAAGMYGYRRRGAAPEAVASGNPPPAATASAPLRGPISIDMRRQQLIGVHVVPVAREPLDVSIRAAGIVAYDETKQSDVNIKVEGWIRQLAVDATGQLVQKGQALFTLYSPDLLNAQREYLLALRARDQMSDSPVPEVHRRAEALAAAARQRLTRADLSDDEIGSLEASKEASDSIVFRSPVSGVVIEKHAVAGMHVMPGDSLYKVVSLADVWVEADVYETDIASLRVGMPAAVALDAYPGETLSARIGYIYPYFDDKTRTNKVRFELANGSGRLKPGMYAHVDVKANVGQGIVVPTNAVLDSGTEQIVFVAQGDGVFEPRSVKVGRRLADKTQIVDGLTEGEQVATGAAFFLDSESQLRASTQSYEAGTPPANPATPTARLAITLTTQPDPPKRGENQLEVRVRDASGQPVDGADVRVQFFMPAMPAMSMPAMQSEAALTPAGGGTYRGAGQILMSGTWDVTIVVSRGGARLGSTRLPVVAQ